METVIVERRLDQPLEEGEVKAMAEGASSCLGLHHVRWLGSYLSADGLRMICVFEAPDAESVRIANRQAQLPFERVWSGTRHEPQ